MIDEYGSERSVGVLSLNNKTLQRMANDWFKQTADRDNLPATILNLDSNKENMSRDCWTEATERASDLYIYRMFTGKYLGLL